jgi:beta-glucosidase
VVLLKNEGQLLPLKTNVVKSIAVIGPSADLVVSDWYAGTPPYAVSVLEGIRNVAGTNVLIRHAADNKGDAAVRAARQSDFAVVCVGNHPLSHGLKWGENHVWSDGREEVDRQAISLEQEDLVKLIMANNPRTVLVLVSSFPYAIPWSAEHVPAILHITQSSQELGNGLADILFGLESPAGRLVQTWVSSIEHLPPLLDYDLRHGRTYMYLKEEPLFAFGHGLTYTTFAYSNLRLSRASLGLRDTLVVSCMLRNQGAMDSDEVVQVYVAHPRSQVGRPRKQLKGFRRVHVAAGTAQEVSIPIQAVDLVYWDVHRLAFLLEAGPVEIQVGRASDQIHLTGTVRAE